MYHIRDNKAAIRVTQRYLSKIYRNTITVSENGVFDEKTIAALNMFQKEHELEIVNYVDFDTFSKIFEAYLDAERNLSVEKVTSSVVFPISRGTQSNFMLQINSMLTDVLKFYSIFDAPGITNYYSAETENAVKYISKIFGLPEQTEIDQLLYLRLYDEWNSINTTKN